MESVPNTVGWIDLLETFYAAGDSIAETDLPAFVTEPVVTADASGITVEASLDPASVANVSQATISYGIAADDGSTVYYGDEPATIADDGSGLVTGSYDLTVLNISDGTDTATAYITLRQRGEGTMFGVDVPMLYYPPGSVEGEPGQDIVLSIVLDPEGNVIDETYYSVDTDTGTVGELSADPEGIVVPQLRTVAADGTETWTPTSDVGLYADPENLTYSFEPLETGTPLVITLTATDFGGHTAATNTLAEAP